MFIYEDEALKSIRHINHGFFGRTGGVSKGLYKSLNTAYSSHDDPENISQNREVIIGKLGAQQLSACQQVHSADIVNISAGNALSEPRPHADGMVTQTPGIALGIQTADCLPILAADKNKPVIGAVHSGWGGAFQGIASHMIKRMVANGANVEDIVVAIGPGIQQASYQVGQEFYDRFIGQHEKNKMFFEPSDKAGAFQSVSYTHLTLPTKA